LRRRLAIRFAAVARWLHIYLSLFALAAVLFFGVTGLTLNHPDWFFAGSERTVQVEGRIEARWLRDPVDRLAIVEHLRRTHGVRGSLSDFRVDEPECSVSFKGPGLSADAFIDRATGAYRLTQSSHGFVAVLNDLHKGRDTGTAWSVVIDVAAVATTVIALTGLVLLFYLKRRRIPGLIVALVGLGVVVAIVVLAVP
jgi:hypothetical protein